jgi:hypothetical protein
MKAKPPRLTESKRSRRAEGIECDFRRLDGYSFRKSVDLLRGKVNKAT